MPDTPLKAARTPMRRINETPLIEAVWVTAARHILVRGNVRGIKVDALCARLGVTKGSFYHHFDSLADLLAAMLNAWHKRMTLDVIQNIGRPRREERERLRTLIGLPRVTASLQAAQVEKSIRDWGAG